RAREGRRREDARRGAGPEEDGEGEPGLERQVGAICAVRSALPLSLAGALASLSGLLQDPLAHRALDALVRAQARLTRALGHDLERHGISVTGFSFLVVMQSAGGSLE